MAPSTMEDAISIFDFISSSVIFVVSSNPDNVRTLGIEVYIEEKIIENVHHF